MKVQPDPDNPFPASDEVVDLAAIVGAAADAAGASTIMGQLKQMNVHLAAIAANTEPA